MDLGDGRTVEIVVATPHAIHLVDDGGVTELSPSGPVPRFVDAETTERSIRTRHGSFPLVDFEPDAGRVDGLPPRQEGTVYVVSRLVAERATDRDDLVFPIRFVRDVGGAIIGCAGFGRIAR